MQSASKISHIILLSFLSKLITSSPSTLCQVINIHPQNQAQISQIKITLHRLPLGYQPKSHLKITQDICNFRVAN